MKFNRLGNTGLLISDLSLGTMTFGEENSRGTPSEAAIRIVHRYLDAGGNHLDTANVYAGGRSEEIVGQAIKNRRSDVVLATKMRVKTGDGPNEEGLSRHHIIQAVEQSLHRLQTDYIDLYYMHLWDMITPLEESLRAFDDLVTSGKVRYIGVSNFKAWQIMKALGVSDRNGYHRFVAAQYQYSLVKRDIEYEFTDLCLTEGIGLLPWGPLGGGFLSGKYTRNQRPTDETAGRIATADGSVEEAWQRRNTERNWRIVDAVDDIAQAREATQAQVALAWLRAQSAVASVIIGARTMSQLEDNLGAATINLTTEELQKLDTVSVLPELYPYTMYNQWAPRLNWAR
ncbi:MAG: aldo/keto reductase [Chloroflexota bacterium]